ncbi:MAG: hypothetical protein J5I93_21915, partial [Pirellulaceae bacterium]|nr:hypothetical protein [Pirellulaceae bacterium]
GRPPRQGGGQRPPRPPQPAQAKASRPRPEKPKPVKPITKEMEEGVEPMRSFSDLMQFYTKKKEPPSK